ncbi:glycosyltransferase family 2 protein [Bacteroides acidifaciens]|uniref:glycosyltransferase family 2 protein n=1 Tax=Bacteroides acidifaciens TaxID=85831 RepID=UPI0023C31B06|nr:glycosyltransferase family 2 protein [Bacteroides acidifaciens]MDE6821794.1 glycosyltransferase [Bacteroides acidifaciens]
MNKPILSIITVNFNNNEGLIRTLKSVKTQSFSSYEHIIIDAGSTDKSKETIVAYEQSTSHLSYWTSQPDKGIYDGMNKGIEHANGEYLYFLNSGDCLIEDILTQIKFDGTKYLYGDDCLHRANKKDRIRTYPDIPDFVFLSNDSLCHQACFIHHSLFKTKKYNIDYKIAADWIHCFQCIIIEKCSYRHIPIIIAKCDNGGISSNGQKLYQERIRWFKEYFPPVISKGLIDCSALEASSFRNILPILGNTHKFKTRMRSLISFLYRIHTLFSLKH